MLNELFTNVQDAEKSDNEDLASILKFFLEIQQSYEPAIFIQNVKISEGMFRVVFDFIIEQLGTQNTFTSFRHFGSEFMDSVMSILTVDRDTSKILFNPKHLKPGRHDNSFFTVEVINNTENTPIVKQFVETSKFNFRSFVKTVTEKLKFSYSVRRDVINSRRINPTLVSVGNDLFITEKVRDQTVPWLSTNKLVKFKVLIDGEKCISGGRPGIPGSIYITLNDRTSVILFRKGTCLIVGSKMDQRRQLPDFVWKTFRNIRFLINLFTTFSRSELHNRIVNNTVLEECKDSSCTHNLSCVKCLIKTAASNELSMNRSKNVEIEYLRCYFSKYQQVCNEVESLESMMKQIEIRKPLSEVLQQLTDLCSDPNSEVLAKSRTSVFGLKKRDMINAGLFIQMPLSHKKNVSLFTGNRMTFRSLKSIAHARAIIDLYDYILNTIRNTKYNMGNVFQYTDEELISLVDDYSELFYRDEDMPNID